MPERVRVAVVDDSVAIRVGLPVMLPELDFVASYADAETLLAERPRADVVALDLKLSLEPGRGVLNGIIAVREVAAAGFHVCLYTDERRRFVLAQCLRAGARGVVHKSDPAAAVRDAFIGVAAGESVISQSLVGLAELLDRRGGLPMITERQRQVLTARARGEPWAALARRLFITEGVAREHMNAVTTKFSRYLADASPADLERSLGLAPGDLIDDQA